MQSTKDTIRLIIIVASEFCTLCMISGRWCYAIMYVVVIHAVWDP